MNVGVHGSPLDLSARLDIAIDVAHAVTYLHMYTGMKFDVVNQYAFFARSQLYAS